jgi:hypothetical protein
MKTMRRWSEISPDSQQTTLTKTLSDPKLFHLLGVGIFSKRCAALKIVI